MSDDFPDLKNYDGGTLFEVDFFISNNEDGRFLCAFGEVDPTLLYTVALAYCLEEDLYKVPVSDTLKRSVSDAVQTYPVWLFRWDRPQDVPVLEEREISKRIEWTLLTEDEMDDCPAGAGQQLTLTSVEIFIP